MLIGFRIAITVLAVILWWLSQKWIGQQVQSANGQIGDLLHRWTESFYQKLFRSPRLANALLISSSLVIDAVGFFLIYQTIFGETIRPLLGLFILFGLRQLNQAMTVLPSPEGMIWRDPGVPSIFVTYGVTNDLFFSGHTALAVFGALEIAQLGGWPFAALGALIIVFEVGTVLLLRAHWTMDIFAGLVTALWTSEVVARWAPAVDSFLAEILAHLQA